MKPLIAAVSLWAATIAALPTAAPSAAALSTAAPPALSTAAPPALSTAAPLAGTGAAEALRRVTDGPRTRLVVALTPGADSGKVSRAAEGLGGLEAHRTRSGKALGLTVPSDRVSKVRRALASRGDVTAVTEAHARHFAEVPNDPQWSYQATYLNAVAAPEAWNVTRGSSAVRIAVIDSGVDAGHPDLAGKIVGRYNAANATTDVTDFAGHGTGVASVAAAGTNDGVGVAGSGHDTAILAVKVADSYGDIWSDVVADGVTWAADHGADIINLSLGSSSSDVLESNAVAYARSKGVLVVASAGNDGTSAAVSYPAALPGVLSVGATTQDGSARTTWSNYGTWVDVAAPGESVRAAKPGSLWTTMSGTSFSSPLVAGEAALLLAASPSLTESQLSTAIIAGASASPAGFGHGLVNFRNALSVPVGVPSFTSPAPSQTVDGVVLVSVTSTAPNVRITAPGVSTVAQVVGGVASAALPTYGLWGSVALSAANCDGTVCSPETATRAVTVLNNAPSLTAPAGGVLVTAATVTAAASAAGGTVGFAVDGTRTATDAAEPYSVSLPVGGLSDGTHVVTAFLCNAAASICDTAHSSAPRSFSVHRLHPTISAITPSPFSPNGDRRNDTATIAYSLDQTQSVIVRITNSGGAAVLSKSLGTANTSGAHSWLWNGRTASGGVAPSGTYRVALATSRIVGGTTIYGSAARPVVIDLARPGIGGISVTTGTVFPYPDGYRDSTTVSFSVSEPVARTQLLVYNSSSALVRTVSTGSRAAGAVSSLWNGRTASGAILPAGSYRYRLEALDRAGNETVSTAYGISVSSKRLVKKSASRILTPMASVRETFIGDCSAVGTPARSAWSGSLAYRSNYDCYGYPGTSSELAATSHQFTLPAAAAGYYSVGVSAYGGSYVSGADTGVLLYFDRSGNATDTGTLLGGHDGNYSAPTVLSANYLISGRTIRWLAGTVDSNWYDVKSFTVRWTYFDLV